MYSPAHAPIDFFPATPVDSPASSINSLLADTVDSVTPPKSDSVVTPHESVIIDSPHESVIIDSVVSPFEHLQLVFGEKFSSDQIASIFSLSNSSYDVCESCLTSGPTIAHLAAIKYQENTTIKLKIDEEDVWADLISFYKSPKVEPKYCHLKIWLNNQPAIDTGGIRRQIYTSVYKDFAENKYVKLFDGPSNHLRPKYSAEARSSGLFTVLGIMVGHSLYQDGIGFPFFSPLCYHYISVNEEAALSWLSISDVGEDAKYAINKVLLLFIHFVKIFPHI